MYFLLSNGKKEKIDLQKENLNKCNLKRYTVTKVKGKVSVRVLSYAEDKIHFLGSIIQAA